MTTLLLSAGKATRLDGLAPAGCKALVAPGGETMLDHWEALDDDLTVVVRSEHVSHLPSGTRFVACDKGGGPAVAAAAALPTLDGAGPVTIAYADSWVPDLPIGNEWCGVGAVRGGRSWYVVEDHFLSYTDVPLRHVALVAIGVFRFPTVDGLANAIDGALSLCAGEDEVGFDQVVNAHGGLPFVPIFGWQDVGDPVSLSQWRNVA